MRVTRLGVLVVAYLALFTLLIFKSTSLHSAADALSRRMSSSSRWTPDCSFDLLSNYPAPEARCSMPKRTKLLVEQAVDTTATPALVKCGVPVVSDSIYRLAVNCVTSKKTTAFLHISVDGSDQNLPREKAFYDICSRGGVDTSVMFRTLTSTDFICVYVALSKATSGAAVEIIGPLSLTRIASTMDFEPQGDMMSTASAVATVASFDDRKDALIEAVLSLYPFVSQIRIFFNGRNISSSHPIFYSPKVLVAYSSDHGPHGDIGKFFWVDTDRDLFEYHLTFDDDILYPLEYVSSMTKKLHLDYEDSVVLGVHGVKLVQPITSYIDKNIRTIFLYNTSLEQDASVQLVGTGTSFYAFRSLPISYQQFEYHNMADVWLAVVAQRNKIPRVSVERPSGWLQPIDGTLPSSIWKSLSDNTNLGKKYFKLFRDSLFAQNRVIKDNFPFSSLPLRGKRLKLVLAITTWNRLDFLKNTLESFLKTRSLDYDWTIVIADDGSNDGTLEFLNSFIVRDPFTEVFILKNHGIYACGQTNELLRFALSIDFDYGFKVEDDLIFVEKGWDKLYLEAIRESGYHHLCYLNLQHRKTLIQEQNLSPMFEPPVYDRSHKLVAYVDVWNGDGPFWTFSKEMIERVGFCDELNFPIRGQWHIDLSLRFARAGFTSTEFFYDAVGSNRYITLQVVQDRKKYKAALPWGSTYKKTKEEAELRRRHSVMRNDSRIHVELPLRMRRFPNSGASDFQHGLSHIKVMNAGSDVNRWQSFSCQARVFNLSFDREVLININEEPHASMYKSFTDQQGENSSSTSRNIPSQEAFAYSLSFIRLLKNAVSEGLPSLLVLSDDVILRANFESLSEEIAASLPDNWMIVYLDPQRVESLKSVEWQSNSLFFFQGSITETHAVMIRHTAFFRLLRSALALDKSVHEGALSRLCTEFPRSCLIFHPGLVVESKWG